MRRHLKPNIISWNKDESFEGLLVDFLKSLLNDFYPETKIITSAQDWLIEQLRLKKGPFVIRHAKDLRKIVGREGVIKPRYYFSSDFGHRGIGFDIIASDNESTSSFYSLLLAGDRCFSDKTMREMLQAKIFTGILRKEQTPKIELDAFAKNRILSGMNNYKPKPADSNIKLCHILDAGKNIENEVSEDQLLERAFRCLNPLNVFPFPSSRNYTHYLDEIQYADLGEEDEIQELFAALIKLHFCNSNNIGGENIIDKYYQFLKREAPSIEACEAVISKFKDSVLKLEVKSSHKGQKAIPKKRIQVAKEELRGNSLELNVTRFWVKESTYQDLLSSGADLHINVNPRRGHHPRGTYIIPHNVALSFIEEKRNTPNWNTYQDFKQDSIPRDLQPFFYPK